MRGWGVFFSAGGGVCFSPPPPNFLLFDFKMEHFGAVFKLDLTEETRTQLHAEEAIAPFCLILATPLLLTAALVIAMQIFARVGYFKFAHFGT